MSKPESIKPPSSPEPVAIIGIGCAFPGAPDTEKFWANIKAARDTITDVPASHWRPEDYFDPDQNAADMTYAKRGGFLDPVEFPPLDFGISPNNIEATDTTQLLGMMVARDALRDAGYAAIEGRDAGRPFDRQRTSVILGVTGALELVIPLGARLGHPVWRKALRDSGVDAETAEAVVRRISESYVPWQENSFPGLLGNVAAGRVANRFDLGGTNCVVDAACASSLSAIHMAAMELHAGDADMVISGGLDTFNDIFMYMCFSKTPALSPGGTSRPFSGDGDGTILGEGLGIVVLKRLSRAERDGDRIYAVIRGIGAASDGQGSAIYAPQSRGQAKAMRAAYERSGITPDTVELIEAHGTGTRVGDAVELESVSSVYGEHKRGEMPWCALGSVKSMIGHTKAAAGAAGLIKIALALRHKVLPPTINVTTPLPGAGQAGSPVYLNTETRPWIPRGNHPRRAAVSAFGFGGSNFHCVLEEYERQKQAPDWSGEVRLFALCAETRDALRKELVDLSQHAARADPRALSARSRLKFDHRVPFRLVFVHEGAAEPLESRLKKLLRFFDAAEDKGFFHTPDGAVFSRGDPPGKLCALFPGQGAQYVGMLRDLTCQFPEMVAALQCANQIHGTDEDGVRLSDRIYPVPVFDDVARETNEARLRDTRIAQPAIGALSLGAMNVLRRFGIGFDAAAGHSFGELTALCAAGRMTESDFHTLATARGAIMAGLGGDRGAMLAVAASVDIVQGLVDVEQLDLVIANRNAPEQIVLSGAVPAVDRALSVCESKGLRARRLPVSAAFHSALVADAQRPFHDALKRVEFHSGRCPVYSNTSADPYPDDVNAAKALLSGQLANPVDFVEEIENLHAAGVRTFVEIGPSNRLSGLVSSILASREHHVVAADAARGARAGEFDLACLLARIAALGYPADLSRFDEPANALAGEDFDKRDRLTITLTGANYMKKRSETESRPAAPASVAKPEPGDAGGRAEASQAVAGEDAATGSGVPAPAAHDAVEALRLTQENILALQKIQQQTADLHRQYLESQETSQRAIERLMTRQARLLGLDPADDASVTRTPAAAPAPVAGPAPAAAPEPAASAAAPEPAASAAAPEPAAAAPAPAAPAKTAEQPASDAVAGSAEAGASGNGGASVAEALMAVVVEKTGYPADMLSLDMDLDADLGIDSIKRVEILSALNDALPGAAAVNPEDLGRFRTLADIVAFVEPRDQAAGPAAPPATTRGVEAGAAIVIETVSEKTGYPADMLSLDMDLDADLGIDSIKRVEILSALQDRLPGAKEIDAAEAGQLRTLADVLNRLLSSGAPPPSADPGQTGIREAGDAAERNVRIERKVLAAGVYHRTAGADDFTLPADGEIWISDDGAGLAESIRSALSCTGATRVKVLRPGAQETPANLSGLILVPPPDADDGFVLEAFALLKSAAPALRRSAADGGALLAGILRINGAFGLNGGAISNPYTAGLGGLVKSAAREWPEVVAKVIDVADNAPAPGEEIARLLRRRDPLEVGITPDECVELSLHDAVLHAGDGAMPFAPGDLVVVTGGARGVTAAVTAALAERCRPSFLLLGRSPAPEPEPAWLDELVTADDIRRALIERGAGEARAPAAIEGEMHRILGAREIRRTLDRIRAAGSAVIYRPVDVRSYSQLATALNEARREFGPVRGVIHGAGVLADRLLADKTPAQFELVYGTKVKGFENLMRAAGDDPLKVISVFSSSTARFGRKGQSDYAAANEVLNKRAQQEARRRPSCRVVSINWGPWDGGMVGPELRRLFAAEGVGAIPLDAGAALHLAEIASAPGGAVEVVVVARPVAAEASPPAASRIRSA